MVSNSLEIRLPRSNQAIPVSVHRLLFEIYKGAVAKSAIFPQPISQEPER